MSETKPAIVEANRDPFDSPMPPKVDVEFLAKLTESFAKGQPYARRIGLAPYRNRVRDILRRFHHHQSLKIIIRIRLRYWVF